MCKICREKSIDFFLLKSVREILIIVKNGVVDAIEAKSLAKKINKLMAISLATAFIFPGVAIVANICFYAVYSFGKGKQIYNHIIDSDKQRR